MSSLKKMSLFSFFTGAGGFDLGFESTGYWHIQFANDIHPVMIETLKLNKGKEVLRGVTFLDDANVSHQNVAEIDLSKFINGKKIDLFLGGPPCQSFSVMGKHSGFEDKRGSLVYTFANLVKKFKPRAFLFENVPNIKSPKWKEDFHKYCEIFRADGLYSVNDFTLLCADYGAATIRRRVFVFGLLASENKLVSAPRPSHFNNQLPSLFDQEKPWKTVREVLEGLPQPSYKFSFPDLHFAPLHTPEVIERFEKLLPGQTDHKRKRDRLSWDKPSLTFMAGGEAGGTRNHIHPQEPRELTPRECARIHGFPDEFTFAGNKSQIAIQIANSVPIPMAKAWGNHIYEILNN